MSDRLSTVVTVSPQRVIRPAARRSPAGAGSLLWTAAAAALPVIVTVLVLVVLTLGALLFSASGFDSLSAVVAVEWLVVNRVPLTVDTVELGFLPLLPPLLYVAVLARQTRAVLADVEQPGGREAGAAIAGATVAGLLLTGLASLLVSSAASDFAVRESSLPIALAWTAAVGIVGSGLGVWLYFRHELREILPLWVRGGIHLGAAFVAATWAIAAAMVLVGVLFAWEPIAASLEIGKGFVGTAALAAISAAYLPNVVMVGAALVVGGEAHLGEASYSVFALSRGPMPEVPLAAALPTTSPHWIVQGLLLVTVLVAAGLARSIAHWFRTTADAVKATWLAAAIVAAVMAITPLVAGGELGVLGSVGTGSWIAAGMALLLFGIIGSTTIALSLAGLTRRRERAESDLARRRRRVGGVAVDHEGAADDAATDDIAEGASTDDTDDAGPYPVEDSDSDTHPDLDIEPASDFDSTTDSAIVSAIEPDSDPGDSPDAGAEPLIADGSAVDDPDEADAAASDPYEPRGAEPADAESASAAPVIAPGEAADDGSAGLPDEGRGAGD